MLNRPPLNMLGETLDDREALSGETRSETSFNRPPLNRLSDTEHVKCAHEHEHCPEKPEGKPVLNRPPLNMLSDTLVISKHFPVAIHGDRAHCGTQRETRTETRA